MSSLRRQGSNFRKSWVPAYAVMTVSMKIATRAAEPGDVDALRETMSQPNAIDGTSQLPYPSLELWEKRLAELPAGDNLLVAEVDGKDVGTLGLHAAGNAARCRHAGAIGISLHDAWQRKGFGSALMAAIDLADDWLPYSRLELTVFTDIPSAIALYKKFGFKIEGTHKQYVFRNGEFVDAYAMARLKKQCPPPAQAGVQYIS
jgi:putative acetyltransferase